MAQNQRELEKISPEEYLQRERKAQFKSEYDNGVIISRAYSTKEHVTIGVNLVGEIGLQLKGSLCRVFSAQMRIKVPVSNAYRYPDLSVACDAQFETDVLDVLLNPVVLVEIASTSTERIGRSRKWNQYRTLPSLQDYILILPTRVEVEQRHRADDGQHWWIRVLESLEDELVLDSINCRVRLSDIYAGITLETDEIETDEL